MGALERRDYADLFGMPGDEHDRAGNRTGNIGARGIRNSRIRTVLSPAWTTDWMSDDGRRKLKDYGVAPSVIRRWPPRIVRRTAGGLPAMRAAR